MIYIAYIIMFIIANFLILIFKEIGILLASSIFIPFDFVIRCYFQEQWKGTQLILRMGSLIMVASTLSYLINYEVKNIAIASFFSFLSSQVVAMIIYQFLKKKSYLIKVNGSDLCAILVDSFIFQFIVFKEINFQIVIGQIFIKLLGGFIWYLILFKWLKIQDKWNTK